eukprot:GHVQ01025824.1.p2 GENE.GHVQ01025824.1~~GHVQ01025824.1.p2  ORF type:complete len:120 (-),score=19.97 GHVQ01025824.1:1426-1785(-)
MCASVCLHSNDCVPITVVPPPPHTSHSPSCRKDPSTPPCIRVACALCSVQGCSSSYVYLFKAPLLLTPPLRHCLRQPPDSHSEYAPPPVAVVGYSTGSLRCVCHLLGGVLSCGATPVNR